jgi:flagellar hook-associated protein 3 FlgL
MTITTIATAQQSLNMRSAIAEQNSEVAKLSEEVASGVVSDVYTEGLGAATTTLEMRGRYASTEAYKTTNELLEGKLSIMSDVLGQVVDDAQNILNLSLTESLSTQNADAFQQEAANAMSRIVSALNTTYGGDYLFSGLSTDTRPLELDATGTVVSYNGDTAGLPSARIDEGQELEYGVSANNPAFSSVFSALNTILTTDINSLDDAAVEAFRNSVTSDLSSGITEITSISTQVGSHQYVVSEKIEAQDNLLTIYNNAISSVETAGAEETALLLNTATTQLEASYQITAMVSGMTLLDYL